MKVKGSIIKQEAELEATKEEMETFFHGIVPEFIRDLGGILSDNVKFWRFKNQVKIVKKAKEIIEENNLPKQQVPLKVLAPLIENSSLEEEESMQDKWSNLLANAISGSVNISANFVEILKELSPLEAKILDLLYQEASKEPDYNKRKILSFSREAVAKAFSLSQSQSDLIIENMYRLNLCQPPGTEGIKFGQERVSLRTTNFFELTTLGYAFIQACLPPSKIAPVA